LTSGPHAFSGKFGEAIKKITETGSKLPQNPPNWGDTKAVIDATKKGFDEWKQKTTDYFNETQGSVPANVQSILDQMQDISTKLAILSACVVQKIPAGGGGNSSQKLLIDALFACDLTDADIAFMKELEGKYEGLKTKLESLLKPPPISIENSACFSGTNPADAPKTAIQNWYGTILHKDWKHIYADWGNFITIKENGKYFHICRQTTDGWGDEKFLFVEAGKTNYQEFKPVGYSCPKDTYIAYGKALNKFGDMMEKSIIIAATTFTTGGLGSVAGLGVLGEIGLNMGVEASKQMVTLYTEQGKDFSMQSVVDNLDLFDIAIESLPIVNKTIGVMGGKDVAVLAKNYFKDILTATFDYNQKDKWEIAFINKDAAKAIGELLTDEVAGNLIGKYSSVWEKSFTDAGIKQDLAVKIIREFSIKTKEYASEVLNYIMVQYFNRSDLGKTINQNLLIKI
jgi:hypothetical protein